VTALKSDTNVQKIEITPSAQVSTAHMQDEEALLQKKHSATSNEHEANSVSAGDGEVMAVLYVHLMNSTG
jgi:hypothetical protein